MAMISTQSRVAGLVAPRSLALPRAIATTTTATHEAVSIRGLTKSYGDVKALNNLDLEIHRGEVFALLGRNGAGKTTTIEILEGYRNRDSGDVRVLGLDPGNRREMDQLKQRIGAMLQLTTIYQSVRVGEVMRVFSRFYKTPANTGELLELVGMDKFTRSFFKDLSGGQKQRVSLALALVGNPEMVFLDEPTAAMDPQSRHQTLEIVRNLKERGITVLLTTHNMEEAQVLASRVGIVHRGMMAACDTPLGLSNRFGGDYINFQAKPGVSTKELAALDGAKAAEETQPGHYTLTATGTDTLNMSLMLWASSVGLQLTDIEIKHATLEDIFLNLTGGEVRN